MPELYGLGYLHGGYVSPEEEAAPVAVSPSPTPRLSLLVDFVHDINPQETPPAPTWTELVSYVRSAEGFSIKRGRERVLDRNEAGELKVLLGDPDGDLDPDNDASPFFPNVVPMRRIRAAALTDSPYEAFVLGTSALGDDAYIGGGEGDISTVLFDGLIESYGYEYPGRGRDGVVRIRAVDWMGALARERISGFFSSTSTVGRIDAVLDTQPYAVARLFDGSSLGVTVATVTYADTSPLEAIGTAAQTDGGNFYCSRDGTFVYQRPEVQFVPIDDAPVFAHGINEFADVSFVYDESTIYNDITITWEFGEDTFTSQPSIDRYFRRPLNLTLPFENSTDVLERGAALLLRYADPHRVISMLDLSNVVSDWVKILSLDLWDKVVLQVVLPNGSTFTQVSLVEGISISSPNHRDWRPVLWLSPAPFTNLLSEEASDFETGISGWTAESNTTLVQGSWHPPHGSHVLRLLATSEADVSARTDSLPVEPRATYFAQAKGAVRAFGVAPNATYDAHMELEWRDSSDVLLSTLFSETQTLSRTGKYGLFTITGRAPLGAAYARLRLLYEDIPVSAGTSAEDGAFADDVHLQRTN